MKTLKFFGVSKFEGIDRGKANSMLARLLNDEANYENWVKYKVLARDFSHESAELLPFDPSELRRVEIPKDWDIFEERAKKENWRSRMWSFLNSPDQYPIPWLRMADMEAIVERSKLRALFDAGRLEDFRSAFINDLASYSAEIADREKRHRV